MSELQRIPIVNIRESKTNPRRTFNDAELGELAESIKSLGVLQPPMVRPRGKKFELVFGARRFRASQLAGLTEIDCLVREMNDAEVLDAQIIENLQRSDVHPLEEAECMEKLLASKLYDSPQAVADKIGRPVKFVHLRLKLTGLHDSVKKALVEGEIGVGWAELVSTIDSKDQAEALASARQWHGPKTVPALRNWLRNQQINLENAPFKLTNAKLRPEAGACTVCPFNTDNQLIPDESGSYCTKSQCFNLKCQAHVASVVEKFKKKGIEPIELSSSWNPDGYLGTDSYYVSTDDDAETGVVVHSHYPVELGKVVRFERNKWRNDSNSEGASNAKAERKAQIKEQRVETRYRFRLYEAITHEFEKLIGSQPESWELIKPLLIRMIDSPQNVSLGGVNKDFLPPSKHDVLARFGDVYSYSNSTKRFEDQPWQTLLTSAFEVAAGYEVPVHDYHKVECPVLEAFAKFFNLDTEMIRKEAEIELMSKKERKEAGL